MLVCVVIAAVLPGDAITMALETVPLYILYEVSILVASLVARRDAKRERAATASAGSTGGGGGAPPGSPPGGTSAPAGEAEPDVKQIIDHVDRELS